MELTCNGKVFATLTKDGWQYVNGRILNLEKVADAVGE